ncbi:DNA/RNA non-specific endonuclease [Paenibacillus sp. ACRSA]|uniref:DNA/RNA non-specific endonuclease n=1 Tax=Paenibacillus sp. ACRSA TaxID=2918211 RepID=UPI001EF4532D|nr:DNA/RNA non-specific endonuclease [Paenibacillus sp. ACRSA]MCG7376061.1 DNA/RNA non-specific endonuclease [Paenibacillus sp. ACRSA]
MSVVEAAVGMGNIRCISPYTLQNIQHLRIERSAGEHARLYLQGIIPEEHQDQDLNRLAKDETVSLVEIGEQGQEVRKLFQGLVLDVSIRRVQGIYILELEAVSYSYLLDIEPRIRSFQNKDQDCEDVIRQVLKVYPKSDVIDYVSGSSKLGALTLQYRETDWQFLRRLASRFGAAIIPEISADSPKLYIGVPDGRYTELPDQAYTLRRDMKALKEAWSVGATGVTEKDFTSYMIDTHRWLALGDTVLFHEEELKVAACVSQTVGGLLRHTVTLSPESGIRQNEIRNDDIAGAALEGKIIGVTKDTVKVHLDVDASQSEAEASWMPYSAVYAGDGGGFYSMPESGSAVQVYFASGQESDAFAMGSVRRGSQPSPKTADPATKSWGTNYGKEMKMTDSEMSLIATEGSLFITLDGGGVTIQSNSGIVASGGQEITLESEKKIGIEAQETIFLQCGDSSMILDGMTDLKGSEVLLDGLIKMPVTVEDLEPVPEAPFVSEVQVEEEPEEEKKGFWGKVLDVTQTVLDVVGMIPVVGEVADLANAAIYAARGDYTNAALSAAAAIPFVGWAATGAKFAIKGAKLVKKAGKVVESVVGAATKIADKAGQVAKAIGDLANKAGDAISGALGKVMTKAKGLASNFSPADLANKLKGKLDALMMKSPMLENGLKMAGGMAKGFMQNLLMSEAMNYGLEQLSQYVDSDTITKAMILMSMLSGKSKKNQNQGITSNNKGSGDKDKSKKNKDSGNKDKDKSKDTDKTKDRTKDEPNKPKPKDQETDKSKGKTGDNPKDSSSSDSKKDKDGTDGTGKENSTSKDKTMVGENEQYTNGRKNRLKPNIRYKTGEYDYFYETDGKGRITKFETDSLQLTKRTERLSHSRNTPGKIKGQDEAGHLAGDRFGGSPKVDNLVSQLSDVNQKKFKKLENKWADALKEKPPKKVTVDVEIVYLGNNLRPDKFIVKYTIDGKPGSAEFKNY